MTVSAHTIDTDRSRLVFRVGERRHQIDAGSVLEVLRVPHITRVPNGPDALAGIVNHRGRPVPVLSMARILSSASATAGQDGKIIVYDHGGAIGLLVDDVLRRSSDGTADQLVGLHDLIDTAFKSARQKPGERPSQAVPERSVQATVKLTALLSFRVAGQLYALPLDHVREVLATLDGVSTVPSSEDALVGLVELRGAVLPLFSLASLLGLDDTRPMGAASRTVVVEHDGDLIGLVVDELDAIRRLPDSAMDALPSLLKRGRGEAQIDAIGRISEIGRLVSILSPERLFRHDAVTQATSQNTGAKPVETTGQTRDNVEQFLLFQLGEETYGLPIGSVDEVVRVPQDITRVPGAPDFVLGVANLRSKVIPLIDQRARFDTPMAQQTAKARAIIVTLGNLQAGFVVDGVSEVKAIPSAALSAAPAFSSDRAEVFDRIAHTESDGTVTLIIDPRELLSRAERDVVAAIADAGTAGPHT